MPQSQGSSNAPDDGSSLKIRDHFLGWQCRLRQHSIRHSQGQPTVGMRPAVLLDDAGNGYEGLNIVLVRKEPDDITTEFQHMVRRTRDPKQRYDSALKYLAENFYQKPKEFSDCVTVTFTPGSASAARLQEAGNVTMVYEEKNQRYRIPCRVSLLTDDDPAWQASYWHNHLFNPLMPGDMPIIQFIPDWSQAVADPAVY